MKIIPLPEIEKQLSAVTQCTATEAKRFLAEFSALLEKALTTEGECSIPGLGIFKVVELGGETVIDFAPEAKMANAVNAPFRMFDAIELDDQITSEVLDSASEIPAETPSEISDAAEEPAPQPEEAPQEPLPVDEATEEPPPQPHEATQMPLQVDEDTETNVAATPPPVPTIPPSAPEPEPIIEPEPEPIIEPEPEPEEEPLSLPTPENTPVPEEESLFRNVATPQPQANAVQGVVASEPQSTVGDNYNDEPAEEDKVENSAADDRGRKSRTPMWLIVSVAVLAGMVIGYFAANLINIRRVKSVSITADDVKVYASAPAAADTADSQQSIAMEINAGNITSENNDAGNQSTENTAAAEPTAKESAAPVVVTDTVRPGRFLTTMALEHYGKKKFWVYIYQENASKLGNPDQLASGTTVVIPPAEKYGIRPGDPHSEAQAEELARQIMARYSN